MTPRPMTMPPQDPSFWSKTVRGEALHRLIAMSNNILAAVAVSAAAILLLAGALQLKQQDVGNSVDGFPRRSELLLSPSAKRKLKEAVDLAGKAPSEQERRHIESILSPVANHLAVRYLYAEVAERARANPTVPGHQAMEHVLASKREMNSIEAEVKNKLYNINSGHWAEEINHKIPKKFHQLLPALATQTAHTATVRAFSRLKQQMLAAEKNPTFMQKLKPSDPKA